MLSPFLQSQFSVVTLCGAKECLMGDAGAKTLVFRIPAFIINQSTLSTHTYNFIHRRSCQRSIILKHHSLSDWRRWGGEIMMAILIWTTVGIIYIIKVRMKGTLPLQGEDLLKLLIPLDLYLDNAADQHLIPRIWKAIRKSHSCNCSNINCWAKSSS